jgi:transcriptional regulator with XRE-family HTH domain
MSALPADDRPARFDRPADAGAAKEPRWRDLVGEEFRAARRRQGDTLRDVARRANLSTQYLSEIERGRKEPSSEIIAAVAEALGLTLLDLTTGVADRLRGAAAPQRSAFRLAA